MNQHLFTEFAPAERISPQALERRYGELHHADCIRILDAVDAVVFVLEEHRQIVFANRAALKLLQVSELQAVMGARPGEVLHCVNAALTPGGCGTSHLCRDCGAAQAVLRGLKGRRDAQECRLTRRLNGRPESLDLLVSAVPLEHGEGRLLVCTLTDISHEKRRAALERIFFHDLLNLAGGMHTLVDGFAELLPPEQKDLGEVLGNALDRLLEEITIQKDLSAAETGDLVCHPVRVRTRAVLESLAALYRHHDAAKGRNIELADDLEDFDLETDSTVLGRVLGNLIKNALEATDAGGTVTLGCQGEDNRARFWVHNPGAMPDEVQRQVFSRSFSTKGSGRGLGTYAVQLLSASCLDGETGFSSTADSGTCFWVRLPVEWTGPAAS